MKDLGLETRTGLHLGEVEMRGEQVSGLAVHTAARVMAAAGEGEVLVSDAVRDAIRASEVSLSERGRHELNGVPGDWQLCGRGDPLTTPGYLPVSRWNLTDAALPRLVRAHGATLLPRR